MLMDTSGRRGLRPGIVFAGILLLALITRLYHINGPLVDQMFVKQVFVANKARSIAGPPFDPLANRFDFLDDNGQRLQLVEEAPVYTGIVGWVYHLFGEKEWLGRIWSILASLLAIIAFKDLVEREFDGHTALIAALFFSICPLFVFYGRAVMPDASMLAGMLGAACCYRRYMDGGGRGWWLAALLTGAIGALFKFYGLMVLLPLADMLRRHNGWRAYFRPQFLLLALGMTLPVAAWTLGIFGRNPNPSQGGVYFIFQSPEMFAQGVLYKRFFERFLWKDVGPIAAALIALGAWAVLTRRARPHPVYAWTVMGILFYFLLGPKLDRHDYYGLMMLPAAALWAALGWEVCCARRARVGVAVLGLAIAIQSPLAMPSKFRLEKGFMVLAQRLRETCSPGSRVVVLGSDYGYAVIHYCGHEGWVMTEDQLPGDWRSRMEHYRTLGAEYAALYLNPLANDEQRASFESMTSSLPLLEHRAGHWARKGDAEYYLFDLRSSMNAGPSLAPGAGKLMPHLSE
jgi:hypothetical protein